MDKACGSNAAGGLPGAAGRIIKFATGYLVNRISNETGSNEHLAVGQQGRGMVGACVREATYFRPRSACRIVHFRTRVNLAVDGVVTSRDQHGAVGEQGCRVPPAALVKAASRSPCSARWIVDFTTGEWGEKLVATCDQNPAVRK